MTRRAAKIDANQPAIVDAFERCGYLVLSLAPMGRGCPDLLVCERARVTAHGPLSLIEVKAGRGTLRPEQIAFQEAGWPVSVVRGIDDVIAIQKDRR